MQTFTTPINEFLDIDIDLPIEVTVKHRDGVPYEVEIPAFALPRIQDTSALYRHIFDAALNNHQSTLNEQLSNDVV